MNDIQLNTQLIQLLLTRLERISADSYWAHRASGVRGALLKVLEKMERGTPDQSTYIKQMIDLGFDILEKASKVIGNRFQDIS